MFMGKFGFHHGFTIYRGEYMGIFGMNHLYSIDTWAYLGFTLTNGWSFWKPQLNRSGSKSPFLAVFIPSNPIPKPEPQPFVRDLIPLQAKEPADRLLSYWQMDLRVANRSVPGPSFTKTWGNQSGDLYTQTPHHFFLQIAMKLGLSHFKTHQ